MPVTGKNARPEKASDRGVERGDGGKGAGRGEECFGCLNLFFTAYHWARLGDVRMKQSVTDQSRKQKVNKLR